MVSAGLRRLTKLATCVRSPVWRRGLRLGVAAAVEHAGALRSIRLGALIDVGANKGQFALAARALHPRARIVAFEPLPEAAAIFARVFADDVAVTLHVAAAAARAGTAEIYVSARADSSSLLPISSAQVDLFPGTGLAARRRIEVVRIDDAVDAETLPGPVMIKLDVQGYEVSALEGRDCWRRPSMSMSKCRSWSCTAGNRWRRR